MNKKWIFVIAVIFIIAGVGGYFLLSNHTNNQQSSISVVDYSDKGLKSFPVEVLKNRSVTNLNLSNNDLSGSLPSEIKNLTSLEHLNVSNNKMTGIPAEIGQLSKLKTLDFSNNEITGLPMELGNLNQLQVLNLRGNKVSQQDLNEIRQKLPSTEIIQ